MVFNDCAPLCCSWEAFLEFAMIKLLKKNQDKRESGMAIPEAAMTIIAFFVFVFGIMEVGRFMGIQQTVTDAAREGARFGVAPAPGTSTLPGIAEIENECQSFLDSAAIQGSSILVEPNVGSASGDIHTRVTVSVPYQVITLSMFSNLAVTLSGVSMMRHETSP